MILSKTHDIPIRLAQALQNGVDPAKLAQRTEGPLPGEAVRVIDRIRSGEAVTFHQLVCVERALAEITRESAR